MSPLGNFTRPWNVSVSVRLALCTLAELYLRLG